MPCVCRFRGLEIYLWFSDHAPPHFHVKHGNRDSQVRISDGFVMRGRLPRREASLVTRWARRYKRELEVNWDRARLRLDLIPIPPLE